MFKTLGFGFLLFTSQASFGVLISDNVKLLLKRRYARSDCPQFMKSSLPRQPSAECNPRLTAADAPWCLRAAGQTQRFTAESKS